MLSFFRSVANSGVGKVIAAVFLIAILASFAMSDISNFGSGKLGFGLGLGSDTLASVGSAQVTNEDMDDAMQKRLQDVRQQNPQASYADIVGDIDPVLNQLIDQKALIAFTDKYGFSISKRLIDAEIAQIPGVRGLDGKPSIQGYSAFLSRNRLTDAQVRELIRAQLAATHLLAPLAAQPRVPVGVATQYAAMLLESRQGQAAVLPLTLFTAGLKPSDAQVQAFYTSNRNRYMVPEQRTLRFALITPDSVANVTASDQEIAAYYNANQATYGSRDTRTLSQVVVQDQKTAQAIADRARNGSTLAAAAAPAGSGAAVSSLPDQTKQAYASVAGDRVAVAAFSENAGAIIGPIESDFGWVVAKVDSVKAVAGKSLAQATPEISAKLTTEKRKAAMDDLYNKADSALSDGNSFTEVATKLKLSVTTTPLITADGTSRSVANFKLGPNLEPAVKAGFDLAPSDQPDIATLPNGGGYAMVAPAQVIPAAPAPLASIRDKVANDWVQTEALARARKAADTIAVKASAGISVADAVKQSGLNAPVQPLAARRIQVAQSQQPVPPAVRTLFVLAAGKSKAVADAQSRGYFVVKVDKIVPGNALAQPGLIGLMARELQQATQDDYAAGFLAAVEAHLKVRRNDNAIAAMKQRFATTGS
ncbi:peptidyl-prolyl cis-trans isomerase [Sphingomonas sp.]|uniref:peptidyl-prolyl cis-trans isomerase n=1 Tax=Sphingomonas sp. TaxID=28214 RepID=UPI0025E88A5D|nr:peptidyl-prolyl cis-trans isomerase [Sphingomonas sp.]MBV9527687.1 peptidyl-prolyl cis-trans isomerase [Sphingomonas sp.]